MSDDQDIERRYLIVIRFDDDADNLEAVQGIQHIKSTLERATQGDTHLVFNSDDSYLIGLVVTSTLAARQLRAMCEHTMQKDRGFTWVIELGEESSAAGNSSGWRWIQR